jgi:uncharacterized protein YyaL (SSP411 family)
MPNHLANEPSPYLRQHANNPVDWYPWGEEAFARARELDRPIFLSVGYSTCHWCHVMERESFENGPVAEVLNAHFVPIKVDREERPDVDRVYMTYVQATTGSGGWPMSVFLTPALEPFFGGTYFPPDNRYGRPGFLSLLQYLAEAWRKDRARILEAGTNSIRQLRSFLEAEAGRAEAAGEELIGKVYQPLRRSFDGVYGGFGSAPKFPRPAALEFLLAYYGRTKDEEALEMVEKTLRAMAEGGMNDQLGGGFHRYSVDERWFVPHFEKMLYDQAQLASVYLKTYQLSGDARQAAEARRIFDYVLRDMTDSGGGFYSAEDADSAESAAEPEKKSEGAFYLWTQAEVERLAGQPAAGMFSMRYGVQAEGNVREDPHGEFQGKNILAVRQSLEAVARVYGVSEAEAGERIREVREKLLEARGARPRPHRDDKILTSWNALMISALALGARVLSEPAYGEAAKRAARFVLGRLYDPSTGVLLRRYRGGDAAIPAFLDDYACFVLALLDLYEMDFDVEWVERARGLARRMVEQFEDRERGGFFSTAAGDPNLLLRIKEDYDGAEPSGNSAAIAALGRLALLTGEQEFGGAARRAIEAMTGRLAAQPTAMPLLAVALDFQLRPPRQIVLAGDPEAPVMQEFDRARNRHWLPAAAVIRLGTAAERAYWEGLRPALAAMTPVEGRPAAYVCRDLVCELPVSEPEKFEALLQ